MNEVSLFGSDLLFILCAVVVSFALGSLHRLGRALGRQRRAEAELVISVHGGKGRAAA